MTILQIWHINISWHKMADIATLPIERLICLFPSHSSIKRGWGRQSYFPSPGSCAKWLQHAELGWWEARRRSSTQISHMGSRGPRPLAESHIWSGAARSQSSACVGCRHYRWQLKRLEHMRPHSPPCCKFAFIFECSYLPIFEKFKSLKCLWVWDYDLFKPLCFSLCDSIFEI